jgi:hypothetical protein
MKTKALSFVLFLMLLAGCGKDNAASRQAADAVAQNEAEMMVGVPKNIAALMSDADSMDAEFAASAAASAAAVAPAPVVEAIPLPKPRPKVAAPEDKPALAKIGAKTALWSRLANTQAWTKAVQEIVHKRFGDFELAKDKETFCPGYTAAATSRAQKEACWVRLVSAISFYESSFNPKGGFVEPSGSSSIGLLSLSEGECPNAKTIKELKDPIKNLSCGTNKMADLIKKAKYIDGPVGNRGAAAYWSVLRTPYVVGKYKLGKKTQIALLTKKYQEGIPAVATAAIAATMER